MHSWLNPLNCKLVEKIKKQIDTEDKTMDKQ